MSVLDTTELRWFVDGPLPADVTSWFTRDGTIGLVERRVDRYRLDERFDKGVKHRSREKLELKILRSIEGPIRLEAGLSGQLECWRRWSPADGLVTGTASASWTDVHKTVVKRRFSVGGRERVISEDTRAMTGEGCDVEIAAIRVGGVEAWTFAFASFGPSTHHRTALSASWGALRAEGPIPRSFDAIRQSSGYPQWLSGFGPPGLGVDDEDAPTR